MQLCASVGLIYNPSLKDSAGWDFIVDFPTQFSTHPMIDKSASPIECKIQVKATDGTSKKVQITLSNMMRLCGSKLPAFFFFIEYNKSNTPQAVYVRHFDKNLMFKTLQRARENSILKEPKKLNKINITVSFDSTHKLDAITGEHLKSTIESYVNEGMEVYTEKKINHLKNLGYENGGYKLTFQTKAEVEYDNLINASLGWVNKAKVRNIKCFDERFNISMPLENKSFSEADLSFGVENFETDAILKITNMTSKKTIRLECKLYVSPLSINAPDKHIKARLKSSYFDILIYLKTGLLTYRFDSYDNILNLFEIKDNLTIMRWIYEQKDMLEFEINISNSHNPMTLITNANKELIQDTSLIESCIQALNTTENAIIISDRLSIQGQVKTTITKLGIHSDNTNIIGQLLSNPNYSPAMKLTSKNKIKSPPSEINACYLAVIATKLGDFIVLVIITINGKGVYSKNEYHLSNPSIKLEDIMYCYHNEDITKKLITKTKSIADKHMKRDDIVFINLFHDDNN